MSMPSKGTSVSSSFRFAICQLYYFIFRFLVLVLVLIFLFSLILSMLSPFPSIFSFFFFCRSHDHHINIQRAIILSSFVFIDCQMCLCLSKPVCMCSHTRLSFVLFSLFIIGIHTYKQRRACKPSHLILHGSSRSQHSLT